MNGEIEHEDHAEETPLEMVREGVKVWPPFYVYDNLVGCACYQLGSDFFMVGTDDAVFGPCESMEAAIRASGEIAPLIWLEGEQVLVHYSSESDDGRTTTRFVLGRAGAFLAIDPAGELLDGPFVSLDHAATEIHAFDVSGQSRSIISTELSVDEVLSRLRVFEWEPNENSTIEVNGQTVSLGEIWARQA